MELVRAAQQLRLVYQRRRPGRWQYRGAVFQLSFTGAVQVIRSVLAGLASALAACVVGWFVIPESTYVEDALGILLLVFGTTTAAIAVAHHMLTRARRN